MRSAAQYLEDILDCIDRVALFIVDGRDFFLDDLKTQSAVVRELEVIGEAVSQMPNEVKDAYPSVRWKQLSHIRNRLIHGYFTIRPEVVFRQAASLPNLRKEIELILRDLES